MDQGGALSDLRERTSGVVGALVPAVVRVPGLGAEPDPDRERAPTALVEEGGLGGAGDAGCVGPLDDDLPAGREPVPLPGPVRRGRVHGVGVEPGRRGPELAVGAAEVHHRVPPELWAVASAEPEVEPGAVLGRDGDADQVGRNDFPVTLRTERVADGRRDRAGRLDGAPGGVLHGDGRVEALALHRSGGLARAWDVCRVASR